jgi:hypothetical protein
MKYYLEKLGKPFVEPAKTGDQAPAAPTVPAGGTALPAITAPGGAAQPPAKP